MSEVSSISKKDIGKVFKIKANSPLWSIDIQESVCFLSEKYVKLESMSWNNKLFFGKIIESNLFGVIEKSEIMFSSENIDFSEIYDTTEEFNENKTRMFKTFMLF